MAIGDIKYLAGFFTRQINLQGHTLAEIEKRLGFHKGRLAKGAHFYIAEELPSEDGFSFAGYTQVAEHRTAKVYGNINNPYDPAMKVKKKLASHQWSLHGTDRIVKVLPMIPHNGHMHPDQQYIPGSGIQQWKLTRPIKFRLEEFVADYPNGRFIPAQGFTAVKYV